MTPAPAHPRAWALMTALSMLIGAYGVALVASGFAMLPDEIAANDFPLALRVHIVSASVALLCGPWQFSSTIRRRVPSLHRWTGRTYVVSGVVAGVAGALTAPFTANGAVAGAGFLVLGVLWVISTVLAYAMARRRDFAAHRRWAVRSFALAFAAVTLRVYLPVADAVGIEFAASYPVIAWLCWIPNLVVAERLVARRGVAPAQVQI